MFLDISMNHPITLPLLQGREEKKMVQNDCCIFCMRDVVVSLFFLGSYGLVCTVSLLNLFSLSSRLNVLK